MYSIRLELGREAEDLRFADYQRQLRLREIEEAKAGRKRAYYTKLFISVGACVLMFIAIVAMLLVDVGKYTQLRDIQRELEKRPVMSQAHPIIDAAYREELELKLEEEEARKNMQYYAEDSSDMMTLSEDVLSEFVIVVDVNKNQVVASRGGRTQMVPASMTKVLTLLVAAEHLSEAQLDDTFVITPDIIQYVYDHDCSSVGFRENETVTVRDLLYGTILPSGGDAAVGLANYIAGSQVNFVDMMNEKLEVLGLSDTAHFTNCVGLYDEKHYCTAYDIAMIMHAAIDNPLCKEVLSTKIYTTAPTAEHPDGIEISNWFLRRIEDKPCGATVMCAKTGYVKQSGNCATSYAEDGNGNDYIIVVGNAPGNWKCIYDHVKIYRQLYPDYDKSMINEEQEAAEYAGEVSDH